MMNYMAIYHMPCLYLWPHCNDALLVHRCSGVSVEGTSLSVSSWQEGGGLFDHLSSFCAACEDVHSSCLHMARMWCAAEDCGPACCVTAITLMLLCFNCSEGHVIVQVAAVLCIHELSALTMLLHGTQDPGAFATAILHRCSSL